MRRSDNNTRKPQGIRRPLLIGLVLLISVITTAGADGIERITVTRHPVFPETTGTRLPWILRWANRLHRTTTERTIREEILLREGSALDTLRIRESERLLRRRGLFERAEIRATESDSGRTVAIRTQDLWTLSLILSFKKEADITEATAGIKESNLLGTGNELRWVQLFSTDQNGGLASIRIPRTIRTRASTYLFYSDFDDGQRFFGSFARLPETPFDRLAWEIRYQSFRGRQRFFESGEESGASRLHTESASAWFGHYPGRRLQFAYGLGWAEHTQDPRGTPVSTLAGIPPPPPFEERRHRGPLLFAGIRQRRFERGVNLDRYGTTEDIPIGYAIQLSAGPNLRFERDRSRAFATYGLLTAATKPHRHLGLSVQVLGEMFLTSRRAFGERSLFATASSRWQPSPRRLTVLQASLRTGADRPATSVSYLGTNSGLRGFPTREFETNDYTQITLEQRFWSGIELLWTGIGGNLFVDTALPSRDRLIDGTTWRTGWGFGLLLGLRKSLRRPIRVELAWRTDEGADPTLTISMNSALRIVPSIVLPSPTGRLARSVR